MENLESQSVDVVVTSPPYNLGIAYNTYEDTLPREAYLAWTEEWAKACFKVITENGSLFLNVGSKPSDPWVAMDVANVFRKVFILQNCIHWIKSIAVNDTQGRTISYGHYKPIAGGRYLNDCHEFIYHFTKTGEVPLERLAVGVPYQDKSNAMRWSGKKDCRCRGNTWFIPYKTISNRERDRPHPASYPPKLVEQCIRLHGIERISRVMDPFMGIGSAGIACVETGVSFIGYEMDECYFAVAEEQIKAALRKREEELI